MVNAVVYGFGPFALDIGRRLLYRDGELQRVPPKVLDTLILLVVAKGEVVTRESMMQALWPDTVVEEGGLARNISLLRKLLGDSSSASIETLSKRGYRFVGRIEERNEPDGAAAGHAEAVPGNIGAAPSAPPEVEEGPVRAPPAATPARRAANRRWPWAVAAGFMPLLAAAIYFERAPESPEVVGNALTTNSQHLPVRQVSVAPDGQRIALLQAGAIYLRETDATSLQQVSTPPQMLMDSLQWFPDGANLLVSGYDEQARRSAVWIVSTHDEYARRLLTNASDAIVSPDGQWLAFLRPPNQIWLARADGSEARAFANPPAQGWFRGSLQFTHDSRALLNHSQVPPLRHAIESRQLEDGTVTTLYRSDLGLHDFLLLGDGELLVVESLRFDAVGTRLISLDLSTADDAPARTVSEWPDSVLYSLSATPDGERIFSVRDQVQSDVYVADLTRDGLESRRRLTLDDSNDMPSGWSADGGSVLFHSNRQGSFDIYRQPIDGELAISLVSGDAQQLYGRLSPDGRELWYMSRSEGLPRKDAALLAQSLDGTAARTLRDLQGEGGIQCARAGAHCVLAQPAEAHTVFSRFDPATGETRELLRVPRVDGSYFYWALTSDGQRIALIDPKSDDDRVQLFDLRNPATPIELRVKGARSFRSVFWDASDEALILTSALSRNRGAIVRVNPRDGAATILANDVSPRGWAIPSPDGRRLAYQQWTNHGNVWELERQSRLAQQGR